MQNQSETNNNWIKIRLEGIKSNRDAYGSAVSIISNKIKQKQFLISGEGYFSSHAKELYFGIGQSNIIENVEIKWPNGLIQEFKDIFPNQTIYFTEGKESYSQSR